MTVRRAQRRARVADWLAFAVLLVAAATLEIVYAANMIAWRNAPDRGWIGSAETGPHVVAATRPAGAAAGLQVGDRILSVNSAEYGTYQELLRLLRLEVGSTNHWRIERAGQLLEIAVPTRPIGLRVVLLQSGPNLALGLVFFAMGILVFLMKPGTAPSWAFFLLATSLGLVFPYSRSTFLFDPRWCNDVFPAAAFLSGAALLHLAAVFPARRRIAERTALLALPYALAGGLAAFTLAQGEWQDAGGWQRALWYFYPLAGLLVFLASAVATYFRSASVAARLQSLVVFTGTLVALLAPLIELVFARLFGMRFFPNVLYSWMPLVTAFPLSIAYAIVRHDLFEIDAFVRRTYGYLLSTAAIVLLYGATVSSLNLSVGPSEITRSPLFSVGFVLAVVFLMQPLQARLQALVDRAFYRQRYDYRKTITEISEKMTTLLEPELIRETLVRAVVDEMFLENGRLLIAGEGDGVFVVATEADAAGAGERLRPVTLEPALREALVAAPSGLIRHEIELDPRWRSRREATLACFDALAAEILLPMRYQDDLRAVLSLGIKKSGRMFTREDIDLLRTLIGQSTIALENGRLFDDLAKSLQRVQMLETIKANLAKFVPHTVQDLIEGSPNAIGLFDKREHDLSVVFADMTGYTRLSAQLPLDEVNAIVERYFGAFLGEILQHGGDVNETAGDGLMVLFQDDDSARHARAAVRAALGIQRLTDRINAERASETPIGMHIGVSSGIASVGATKIEGGGGLRWTYTASGPTTNVAARLAALGEKIAITEETRRRIGEEFQLEPLGPQTLKNVPDPVSVFRVVVEPAASAEAVAAGGSTGTGPALEALRSGELRVSGLVRERESGHPLPGLLVRAFDKDAIRDDFLGSGLTDTAGRFEIRFLETAFADLFERSPDLYLRIFDASGAHELRSTERSVRWNAGAEEHFEIEIPRYLLSLAPR